MGKINDKYDVPNKILSAHWIGLRWRCSQQDQSIDKLHLLGWTNLLGWTTNILSTRNHIIPSGYVKIAIDNGPVEIVDFPINNGDVP